MLTASAILVLAFLASGSALAGLALAVHIEGAGDAEAAGHLV